MSDPTLRWQSAHIYYYDDNKDNLILNCVRPLFQSVSREVGPTFFVRHWLRGPHLRLRFYGTEERFREVFLPTLRQRVEEYLLENPSKRSLNEEEVRPVHETLARYEEEQGPLVPLYPNNSIQLVPYDRRLAVLKSEAVLGMLEDFYVDTNDLVFEMLEHVRSGNSRLALCLDLMFAVAHSTGSHVTRGFISYRSHAEAAIANVADPAALRATFEEKYQARRAAMSARLNEVLGTIDGTSDGVPFVSRWIEVISRYLQRAESLIRSGEISLPHGDAEVAHELWSAKTRHSEFHRLLQNNDAYKTALQEDLWFQCYRLMLNYLYLHLNRLGIKPLERYMLCHLAANTVEDSFGVSATQMLRTGARNGGSRKHAEA